MATNPAVAQGTLNRVRCSVVLPDFPNLSITSPYMGKNFATIAFEGDFVAQEATGTGVVNSPEPYVIATITVDLLRTQALAANWLSQSQATAVLGDCDIHSDTRAFPAIKLHDTSVQKLDPGAYDGMNPVSRLTLRGVYYINNDLWNL